ncbi:hypothetical protein [[Eubacterium] cellulosolvens]
MSKLIKDIDVWLELKNGNVATAIVMPATVVAISSIVATGIQSIIKAILV